MSEEFVRYNYITDSYEYPDPFDLYRRHSDSSSGTEWFLEQIHREVEHKIESGSESDGGKFRSTRYLREEREVLKSLEDPNKRVYTQDFKIYAPANEEKGCSDDLFHGFSITVHQRFGSFRKSTKVFLSSDMTGFELISFLISDHSSTFSLRFPDPLAYVLRVFDEDEDGADSDLPPLDRNQRFSSYNIFDVVLAENPDYINYHEDVLLPRARKTSETGFEKVNGLEVDIKKNTSVCANHELQDEEELLVSNSSVDKQLETSNYFSGKSIREISQSASSLKLHFNSKRRQKSPESKQVEQFIKKIEDFKNRKPNKPTTNQSSNEFTDSFEHSPFSGYSEGLWKTGRAGDVVEIRQNSLESSDSDSVIQRKPSWECCVLEKGSRSKNKGKFQYSGLLPTVTKKIGAEKVEIRNYLVGFDDSSDDEFNAGFSFRRKGNASFNSTFS